jgi:hypothetical protein
VSNDRGEVVVSLAEGADPVIESWDRARKGSVPVPVDGAEPFVLVVSGESAADTGAIRGRVVLEDGSLPLDFGMVTARPGHRAPSGTETGAELASFEPDGTFLLPGLAPGPWSLAASTRDLHRGEIPAVVVPPNGTVEVVIRLEAAQAPTEQPLPRVEVEVRPMPDPGEEEVHRLKAWGTSWRATKSIEAGHAKDGSIRVPMREAEAFAAWVYDFEGNRAGVATADAPSAETPVEVHLAPAGWIVLPPDPNVVERWVVLRDARETAVFSGFEASLPGVVGEGHRLVVPPGSWSVTFSRGLARRDPRVVRVTVSPRAGTRAE